MGTGGKVFLFCIGISLVLAIPKVSWGARPLTTEDAGVAGKGHVQAEVGNGFTWQRGGDRSYTLLLTPIYGLTDRIELSAEFPFTVLRREGGEEGDQIETGFSDTNLVFKGLVIPERRFVPATLFKSYVKLSNGDEDEGLGSGDEDVGLISVFTKTIQKATFHANVGYVFVGSRSDESLNNFLVYAFAGEYALTEKLKLTGEWLVETGSHFDAGTAKHHNRYNSLLGFTYQIAKPVILDMGFQVGFGDEDKPEYGLTLGASFNIF
ncbi:MAG: transporter [Candidatus Omnitrophica bacterium]|nr:transporter [Candidatus Omnitrophota bacterium]